MAFASFNGVLKRSSFWGSDVPILIDTPWDGRRGLFATGAPLVLASPELKVAASAFLNSSFSFMGHGLYGSSPGDFPEASCGNSCRKASVSVNALVDSGADVHILSYDDARKVFTDVQPYSLRVIGVNCSPSRATCQGSLVVVAQTPSGVCHRIDLGTAHSRKSFPTNLLSLSRLVDVGAVLHFEKGDGWF